MSTSTGTLDSSIAYFPFGSTRTGSVNTTKKFTGQRLDATGLYYYGARYYDATIGRFISPDSVGQKLTDPQSLNRYTYCSNNPLNRNDPTGHWPNWGSIGSFCKGFDESIISCTLPYQLYTLTKATVQLCTELTSGQKTLQDLFTPSVTPTQALNNIVNGFTDYYNVTTPEGAGHLAGTIILAAATMSIGAAGAGGSAEAAANEAATGRVFWSGGTLAKEAATDYANTTGGMTIGMTQTGQYLNSLEAGGLDYMTQTKPLWEIASEQFARDATGDVNVFIDRSLLNPNGIWKSIEEPILKSNADVYLHYIYVGH